MTIHKLNLHLNKRFKIILIPVTPPSNIELGTKTFSTANAAIPAPIIIKKYLVSSYSHGVFLTFSLVPPYLAIITFLNTYKKKNT